VPELGEEAVAWRLVSEAAGLGGPSIVFEAEGESSIAGDAEEVFEELGFDHGEGVLGRPAGALVVVASAE
jgi:hypothetical protein